MNTPDARTVSPKKQRGRPRKIRPVEEQVEEQQTLTPAVQPTRPLSEEEELMALKRKLGVLPPVAPVQMVPLDSQQPLGGTISAKVVPTPGTLPKPVKTDQEWRKALAVALLLRLVEFNGKINSDYPEICLRAVNDLESKLSG